MSIHFLFFAIISVKRLTLKKIQTFLSDVIRAIFGLFILTSLYAIFFSDGTKTEEITSPIKHEINMEEAIDILNQEKNETVKKEDLSVQAFVICKDLIKEKLLSPYTADFPFIDRKVWDKGEQSYKIRSYVDSQNEYGAKIRTNWNCYMKYKGSGEVSDPINWEHELEFI